MSIPSVNFQSPGVRGSPGRRTRRAGGNTTALKPQNETIRTRTPTKPLKVESSSSDSDDVPLITTKPSTEIQVFEDINSSDSSTDDSQPQGITANWGAANKPPQPPKKKDEEEETPEVEVNLLHEESGFIGKQTKMNHMREIGGE